MRPVPRIAWISVGGLLALAAIFFLTKPPPTDPVVAALRPRRVVKRSPARRFEEGRPGGASPGSLLVSRRRFGIDPDDPPPAARALSEYHRLSHRNLFRPLVSVTGESGQTPGLPPASPGPLPFPIDSFGGHGTPQNSFGPWIYVGFSSEDGEPRAMLENIKDHKGQVVRTGERVDGSTVVSVSRDGVHLLKSGKAVLLLLTNGADAGKNAPKPSGAKMAAPPGPSPGGSPAGPSPGGPPGIPTQGGPSPGGPSPGGPPPPGLVLSQPESPGPARSVIISK